MKYRIQNEEGIWLDEKAFTGIFLEMLKNQLAPYIDMVGGAGTIIIDSSIPNAFSIEDEFGQKFFSINPITGQILSDGNPLGVSSNLIAFADGTPTAGGISINLPNPAGVNAIASCFEFKGSTSEGTPTSIDIVLDANSASPTHSVEIYDITNAQSIGSVTGRSVTGKSILTINTLANIPTSPAIFELRLRKDAAGAVTVIVSSLSINY